MGFFSGKVRAENRTEKSNRSKGCWTFIAKFPPIKGKFLNGDARNSGSSPKVMRMVTKP